MKPFVVLSCVSGKIPTVSPVKVVWQIRITIPKATARAENLFGICQSNLEWRSRPSRPSRITYAKQYISPYDSVSFSFDEKFVLHLNKILTSIS
jgi:hypothetical protein